MRLPGTRAALVALMLLTLPALEARATALGTAITYQGRIDRNGLAANDTYSLILRLFDAASGGTQVGSTQTLTGVVATNGLFSVTVDFGAAAFGSQARWLDVQIKGSADMGYTPMAQRQALTATPFAMYALNSGGTSQWVSDGVGNITYTGGAAGITGQSTHAATGVGVFFDGGNTAGASVYGYNYGTSKGIPLYLNSPGGNVLVGSVASPGEAKLDVLATARGIQSSTTGSIFNTGYNAAIVALGYSGNLTLGGAPCMGLYSASVDAFGAWGISTNSYGVAANCLTSGNTATLAGPTEGMSATSTNVANPAGRFNAPTGGVAIEANGIAKVKTLQIVGGADLAERFEAPAGIEAGTVMAIDPDAPGRVRIADGAYARTVAGVVSGANGLAAGVELAKDGERTGTVAVALTGRVWVKCDAANAPIRPGDLLTSAARAGYAMRADDPARAQGAILGKAMTSLERGTGLVLVLVSLQ